MTREGDALLARIASHPDDDAAYLVYADWLGGQNDPQGELIVLMHQLSTATDDARRAQLGSALDAYFTKHRGKLFGELAKHTGIAWDFHLGFLRSVRYLPDTMDKVPSLAKQIVKLPIARFLRELIVFRNKDDKAIVSAVDAVKPATLPGVTIAKCFTSLDDALDARDDVRWLQLSGGATLPAKVMELSNVEWLEIKSGDIAELPKEVGKLTKLRRLDIDWCMNLASLPEELFGIETLQYISMYDCFELRGEYHMGRLNSLLGGFVRARTPSRRRIIELNLLLGRAARVQKLATTEDLLSALDSNVGDVRGAALTSLARTLPDPFETSFELGASPSFAVLGKMNFDKKQIVAKLAERGAACTMKLDDATTHVVLGESPGGKHAGIGARPIVLEQHLKALFAAKVVKPAAAKPGKPAKAKAAKAKGTKATAKPEQLDVDAVRAQLRSRDEAKTAKAIAVLKEAEFPPELLVDLLIVVQDVSLDKSRDAAKKLFAIVAPPSLAEATRAHLKSSLLLEGLGETKRADRISEFCRAAEVIDPMLLAQLLVERASVGLGYVFGNGKPADITHALETLIAKSEDKATLDLRTKELYAVPVEVGGLAKCKALNLSGNHLEAFPEAVLAMKSLTDLRILSNRVWKLPDSVAKLKVSALYLGGNRMRKFPMAVLGIPTLRELDVSNSREYVENEARIRGLPDEIRQLKNLRKLGYRFNILESFPDGLYALKELEELDLFSCDLPAEIPSRLVELKKLKRLDVRYTAWNERVAELKKLLPKVAFDK